jgi:hypothetical protein
MDFSGGHADDAGMSIFPVQVLRLAGFNPERPACFVLEGFLYYFDEETGSLSSPAFKSKSSQSSPAFKSKSS